MFRMLLPLLLLAAACTDPYVEATKLNTIEAFEAYLTENPSGAYRTQATLQLEELYLERAREELSMEAFDAYIQRFPEGVLMEKVIEERKEAMWIWANEEDTPEAYQSYLDEYPSGNRTRKEEARRRMNMAANKQYIEIGPIEMEQINLAKDPEGPLNGWAFYVDVTNNHPENTIAKLTLQISLLSGDGGILSSDSHPSVGSRYPGRSWIEDPYKVPLQPGESRTWEYTTGDMPTEWGRKAKVQPIDIRWVEDEE